MCVLQYVCGDGKLDQVYDVPVFLCCDGQLRSLSQRCATTSTGQFNSTFYIGTDEEATLFDKSGELFLALNRYPPFVSAQIDADILGLSKILIVERFGIGAFKKFCAERLVPATPFHFQHPETVEMSQFNLSFEWIQSLWDWLDQKSPSEVSEAVSLKWLIPLDDGKSLYRALHPHRIANDRFRQPLSLGPGALRAPGTTSFRSKIKFFKFAYFEANLVPKCRA
jgi:hypothetical protein